jgi:hypothetical protein
MHKNPNRSCGYQTQTLVSVQEHVLFYLGCYTLRDSRLKSKVLSLIPKARSAGLMVSLQYACVMVVINEIVKVIIEAKKLLTSEFTLNHFVFLLLSLFKLLYENS